MSTPTHLLLLLVAVFLLFLSSSSNTCLGEEVLEMGVGPRHQPHQRSWILFRQQNNIQSSDERFHDSLAKIFDYRGSYGSSAINPNQFGLIVGDQAILDSLSGFYQAHILAAYNPSSPLWIVECDDKQGPELVADVTKMIQETGVTVHHRDQYGRRTRFVVEGNLDKLFQMPKVAFIPVPMNSIRPSVDLSNNPAHQLYLKRKKGDASIEPDPVIAGVIATVSQQRLNDTVTQLSSYYSRQSYALGALEAQKWLEQEYLALGFRVITIPFGPDYSDNVIAELKGEEDPSKIVVLSAHYDSRSTNRADPLQRAPGADDNASGTSNILEVARVIVASGLKFKYTLRFCSWSGEEQGLVGSRAYAKSMRDKNEDIIAALNSDMLGWTLPDTKPTLGMMAQYSTGWLTDYVNEISQTYVPDLANGPTDVCCSDQQSFFEQGYPAAGYFENTAPFVEYPYYHQSDDLPENLNFEQIALMTQAYAAATLSLAAPLTGGVPSVEKKNEK